MQSDVGSTVARKMQILDFDMIGIADGVHVGGEHHVNSIELWH